MHKSIAQMKAIEAGLWSAIGENKEHFTKEYQYEITVKACRLYEFLKKMEEN